MVAQEQHSQRRPEAVKTSDGGGKGTGLCASDCDATLGCCRGPFRSSHRAKLGFVSGMAECHMPPFGAAAPRIPSHAVCVV